MTARLLLDPETTSYEELEPAAEALLNGGVIAGPTASFYALMARVDHREALERVLNIKGGRGQDKAFLILIDTYQRAKCYAREIPPSADSLIETFWPGPLTILFAAQAGLHHSLTGLNRTVGIRMESLPLIRRLVRRIDRGLTGTSANPGGRPPAATADQVAEYFGDQLDLIIDGGPTGGALTGLPSTIVDASLERPRLLRPGAVATEQLKAVCPELLF